MQKQERRAILCWFLRMIIILKMLKKIERKNFNFIVLNSLENKETCFESFKNKITIIDNHNTINFDLKSKKLVAKDIVNHIIKTK